MIGGIQLSTPGLTSSPQLHDQNTDTGTTSSSFQLKTGGSGPKIVEKNNGFEVQKADGTVLFYLDINGKIQIGGATGPNIANSNGDCVIQNNTGEVRFLINSNKAKQTTDTHHCGISRKINVSAETTLTGASVTIANVAPQGSKIIASGFIVSELITSADGAVSFSVDYNAGAARQAIVWAQAFAKNTKDQVFFDNNTNNEIATAQVDHVITPNTGTFSGGKVYTFCISESLVAFDDLA